MDDLDARQRPTNFCSSEIRACSLPMIFRDTEYQISDPADKDCGKSPEIRRLDNQRSSFLWSVKAEKFIDRNFVLSSEKEEIVEAASNFLSKQNFLGFDCTWKSPPLLFDTESLRCYSECARMVEHVYQKRVEYFNVRKVSSETKSLYPFKSICHTEGSTSTAGSYASVLTARSPAMQLPSSDATKQPHSLSQVQLWQLANLATTLSPISVDEQPASPYLPCRTAGCKRRHYASAGIEEDYFDRKRTRGSIDSESCSPKVSYAADEQDAAPTIPRTVAGTYAASLGRPLAASCFAPPARPGPARARSGAARISVASLTEG